MTVCAACGTYCMNRFPGSGFRNAMKRSACNAICKSKIEEELGLDRSGAIDEHDENDEGDICSGLLSYIRESCLGLPDPSPTSTP